MPPLFPIFKPLELADRETIGRILWEYQPDTSELTFTNLFMWRAHYGFQWSLHKDWLLIVGSGSGNGLQALPPIGPGARAEVTRTLLQWMKEERGLIEPHIDRADQRIATELQGNAGFILEPTREHFDYVYKVEDLIHLAGKNYRAKRNHLNYLSRTYKISYERLDELNAKSCLALSDSWCKTRRCEEDLNLLGEWEAIREALGNLTALGLRGGVIVIDNRVEAFTIGEFLNRDTVVIHFEKANAEIRGLYALINQQFCEKEWQGVPFVNREQDLGEPGLRQAKLGYNPARLVEKFRIRLT
jgi:uncharacterized protein